MGSSSFRINRELERVSPFNRRNSESCRIYDRNATSTRLFNGDLSATGMKSISVDDQLNSLADARLPFKQASTRTLNTRLMSEMRKRLIQIKETKDKNPATSAAS